jgi:iron only hydrogenase large subunit-like protein
MNDVDILIQHIEKKEKLVAMLAPSFPIMFSYPSIITMLKKLGFSYVVEVAVGAKKTNEALSKLMREHPESRYITSPCPTIVRMVKKTMPQYAKYFTTGVDSPMAETAKVVEQTYPGHRPVFIGPCIMKKLEAKEDIPELNILVLTYVELSQVFSHFDITEESNTLDHFDISQPDATRMYAVDGGLTHSSGIANVLQEGAVRIVSGAANNKEEIEVFDRNTMVRLLDILNCTGGCIGGPGIQSTLTLEERKQKIIDFMKHSLN